MPTYEYRCRSCGHVFEVSHGMRENPSPRCPTCGGACERVISGGAGVIFKGGGFYATDSRRPTRGLCDRTTRCCGRNEPCESPPCRE